MTRVLGVGENNFLPARIYRPPRCALLELLQCRGAVLGQVVCRRARDDAVPDDRLVRRVPTTATVPIIRPLSRNVHEHLLGIPREQARQVGVEAELDDGVLFLFRGVVVRPALDDLHVGRREGAHGWGARREEVGGGNEGGDEEGDGREEAEGVLDADDGAVHREWAEKGDGTEGICCGAPS